ncbi:hypothetical protein ACFRJ1_13630 [Streptomyces sp. NPDC056773]|uniref:hypothetical protein n=1 Tax=unclassified Streptomyces TaxID=2593676 RepID=UPI00369845EA
MDPAVALLETLAPLDAPSGEKLELIAAVNGTVATFVAGELALAERARQLPWSEAEEQAVRAAWLGSRLMTGDYPLLAGVLATAPGAPGELADPAAMFDRSVSRLLGAWGS